MSVVRGINKKTYCHVLYVLCTAGYILFIQLYWNIVRHKCITTYRLYFYNRFFSPKYKTHNILNNAG